MSKWLVYLSHLKFHDVTACRCTHKACADVPFFGVKLPNISGVLVVVKNFLVVAGPLLNLIRSRVIIFTGGQGRGLFNFPTRALFLRFCQKAGFLPYCN